MSYCSTCSPLRLAVPGDELILVDRNVVGCRGHCEGLSFVTLATLAPGELHMGRGLHLRPVSPLGEQDRFLPNIENDEQLPPTFFSSAALFLFFIFFSSSLSPTVNKINSGRRDMSLGTQPNLVLSTCLVLLSLTSAIPSGQLWSGCLLILRQSSLEYFIRIPSELLDL